MEDVQVRELGARRARRLWVWLLSIPGLLVLLLAGSWFLLQMPAVHAARCYFDAPRGEVLALRCLLSRSVEGRQQPLAAPVILRVTQQDGNSTEHWGESDSTGVVEFNVPIQHPENGLLDLRLYEGGDRLQLLAGGQLDSAGGLRATSRGGWIEGRLEGPLTVRVGLFSGVLAVPFESTLRIIVERDAEPVPQQSLTVELHGARMLEPEKRLETDTAGRTDVPIIAEAHHVELAVRVDGPSQTSYRAALPVVPGAIHARAEGSTVLVESPIPRDVAYVNIIDSERTYVAKTVALQPHARRYLGRFDVAFPLHGKWAVTSSEFDMQSMAAVGWPLTEQAVSSTLERKMWLGLDGLKQGRERAKQLRSTWRGLGVLVAAMALAVELGLLVAYFRSWVQAAPQQGRAFARPMSRSTILLAASCLVSGFMALTWWWWSRF